MPCLRLASPALALALSLSLAPAAPAGAEERIVLSITNSSARAVTGFSVFAMDQKTGQIIDDNLGAVIDPIPAGASHDLRISLFRCEKVHLWARFSDGEEVSGQTDLCRNRKIILHD